MLHQYRNGFTLIELLVVIAIMSLLISILLPTLGAARDQGQSIQCLSNLRQMGVAAAVYQHDHRGSFPPAYGGPGVTWEISFIGGEYVPGTLWQNRGTAEVQQCPSFDGPDNWSNAAYTGYNYNTSFIGHGALEAIPTPARIADVLAPGQCAVFGDGETANGGANKFMRAPLPNPGDTVSAMTRAAGVQGFRHRRATNVVYADGHGLPQRQRYTAGNPWVASGTGFLSDDNSAYDLR